MSSESMDTKRHAGASNIAEAMETQMSSDCPTFTLSVSGLSVSTLQELLSRVCPTLETTSYPLSFTVRMDNPGS